MDTKENYKQLRRNRNLENKRYHCDKCNVSFEEAYGFKLHCKGIKHNPEQKKKYKCELCPEFNTNIKTAFMHHLTRQKHTRRAIAGELLGLKDYFEE